MIFTLFLKTYVSEKQGRLFYQNIKEMIIDTKEQLNYGWVLLITSQGTNKSNIILFENSE